MPKKITSRGISAGIPRVFRGIYDFRAVVIKALPNSRCGNHVWLVKFFLSAGIPRNFLRETEPSISI